ncbi:outer membrane beta-barrel protein [Paracoccus spongiarum]|uniref:Outer membrane beta-barrel protein n=1 Tax=Paracoccus spongiarum TaxID=3064387 RepID=A0ABT9JGK9_9RHOB|nr:outer membrane beta-barrel protein [Paracoccus sp. 2205BS29-5]MDP5308965.1 outer membrane beta-barrel protein [Paracoccus sp. 2205BS29-5]
MAIAALAGSAVMASGQGFSLAEVYVKGFGGATWPSDYDATLTEDGEQIALPSFGHDTGYVLGAAIGAAVTPNLSVELEYAHRSADFIVTDRDEGDRSTGDTATNAVLVNALYLFDGMGATGAVRPYLGAGIGAAKVGVSVGPQDFDSDTLLAYQLIGGVDYALNPKLSLYAEARWFKTESGSFDGPETESFEDKFESVDLLVGMRYAF